MTTDTPKDDLISPFSGGWTGELPVEILPCGHGKPTDRKIVKLTRRLVSQLRSARRDFGSSDERIAAGLLKNRVFIRGIHSIRDDVFPSRLSCDCCEGRVLPRQRSEGGVGLPYQIRSIEAHWLSQHQDKDISRRYSEMVFDLRRTLRLERRWETFIRICAGFGSLHISTADVAQTDIPSPLPIRYDFANWNVTAVFEGTESKKLVAATMTFCRDFATWRGLILKERALPPRSRSSFDQASRDLICRLRKTHPAASDAELNAHFHAAGGKPLDIWAFQKLRQTVFKRRPRRGRPVSASAQARIPPRRFPVALESLMVSGDKYLQGLARRTRKGK